MINLINNSNLFKELNSRFEPIGHINKPNYYYRIANLLLMYQLTVGLNLYKMNGSPTPYQ